MKIGIVGGTGTISTSVVTALLERGHDVTCITRGLSGDVPDGARVLVGDRNDLDWFIPAVRAASFEAGIDFISYQPEQARASLEAFRGVGRFVHTSTVATIGDDFDWLPATEEHPLRPTHPYGVNKLLIDRMYQAAYFAEDFPVTILKPSTTYGQNNVIRQIGWDTTWVDRIRRGLPIVKIGEGHQLHHILHAEDAALGYAGVLEHDHCVGQTYHLVNPLHTTWDEVHRTAMRLLGREVEQVSVAASTLQALDPQRFMLVPGVLARNQLFTAAKLQRDVPEYRPAVSLESGYARAFEALDRGDGIESSPVGGWEDRVIDEQGAAVRRIL
ncbi:hypothetical protein JCM18899A_44380 [Nocardioides sp. AN3]